MSPRNPEENARLRAESTSAIVRGALEAFTEKGYHAATTAEIAERAGVSKGLIYNYFSSKEELLRVTIEQRLGIVLERIAETPGELKARDRLRWLIEQLVELTIGDVDAMRLYLALLLQPGASEAIRSATDSLTGDFEKYYETLRSTMEELGHPRPLAASLALHSALNGIMLNLVVQPELVRRPDRYPLEQILDVLVSAFAPKPDPNEQPFKRSRS